MPVSSVIPCEATGAEDSADSVDCRSQELSAAVPDGQLLRRYLRGREETAFAQLVSRFGPLVYAVAVRMLRDHHAAEDIFQATFLVLARDAARIRSPESVGAWLHGTAMRIAKRALARRQREALLQNLTPREEERAVLDEISDRFEQQLVDEELRRLPAAYRAPLVLHVLEGKTCEETAAALGTSVGAVRGRMQRGKRELKLRLIKRGVEVPAVVAAVMMWRSVAEAAVGTPLVSAAIKGGMALTQGTSMPPACSPEAVHLATKETAMFTIGKVLISCAVLFGSAAMGWFAHAATAGGQMTHPAAPARPTSLAQPAIVASEAVPAAAVILSFDESLAFLDAADKNAEEGDEQPKGALVLRYGDGEPDGKKSLAGTGEMIRFTLPDDSQKLKSLRVHCARYGYPKPPDENAEVRIVSEDGTDLVHTEFVPYATFKRGESRWTTIRFKKPVAVPETFWVILEFNAERTKGVYVSYDTSTGGEHSRIGVPGGAPKKVGFDGDWMVQAILTKPE